MWWLWFSIMTVLLWGTSDVIFKSVSEEKGEATLLAYNGIVLGVAALLYMVIGGFSITMEAFLQYIPIALIYVSSMFCYYRAISKVQLSIASPIANSSCAITSIMATFILGQRIEAIKWVAIGVILFAIITLSIVAAKNEEEGKKKNSLGGILWALAYFVLDGVGSFMDDYTLKNALSEEEVLISYGIIYMIIGIGALFIALKQKRFAWDTKTFVGSVIETAGQFTYIYAFAFGESVIASPFIASFSVVSVLLSRIFLKEKLPLWAYGIIGLMVAAMIVLSL